MDFTLTIMAIITISDIIVILGVKRTDSVEVFGVEEVV